FAGQRSRYSWASVYAFVEWAGLLYLVANGAAIFLTGLYRYVLEARWTWG
ncbi:MAG: hypothetical protein A07HN63_00382, partial [uncultured archaeon A07HN63]